MKEVTVAVVGCGRIAESAHFPALSQLENVRIKYACDLILEKAAKIKEKFSKVEQLITDYKIALSDPEVDAVYVLTPNYVHYTVTMDALRAGKHVFCEKPITVNYSMSREMSDEAEKQNRMLNIGVCNRYHKSVELLEEMNRNGKFGNIYHVYCSFRAFRSIPGLGGSLFTEMVRQNLETGVMASLNWAWCYGRVFQTAALFMLGMQLGRLGLFKLEENNREKVLEFWQRVCFYCLPIAVILFFAKDFIFGRISNPFLKETMETILNSYYNLAFMLVMVSAFLLLYWVNKGKVQKILVPYGKMSLTDYITQSVIGSFIYYGYGLEMHLYCGTTVSLLIGIVFFLLQLAFAHWWFLNFKRGPLETIWHRLTWMGKKH